jgi:hypothetical protein
MSPQRSQASTCFDAHPSSEKLQHDTLSCVLTVPADPLKQTAHTKAMKRKRLTKRAVAGEDSKPQEIRDLGQKLPTAASTQPPSSISPPRLRQSSRSRNASQNEKDDLQKTSTDSPPNRNSRLSLPLPLPKLTHTASPSQFPSVEANNTQSNAERNAEATKLKTRP